MRCGRWPVPMLCLALLAGATVPAPFPPAVRGAPANSPQLIDLGDRSDVDDQDALTVVDAAGALQLATGAGVHVAVLDAGFDLRHEYLDGHLGAGWDAFDQDSDPQDLGNGVDGDSDGYTDSHVGHGTFVAGLILACAPDVTIHPIRVLDDEGNGNAAALARGIQKALDLGCDVINLSLVATATTTELEDAIQDAVDAGVVLVTSAGNDPAGPYDSQFLRDRSITVGACTNNLGVAGFSPNAALVDVFAPGESVVGPLGGATDDSYATWSGTSFACAFVSAAAALVKEDHPSLGFSLMNARIMAAVSAVTGAIPSTRGCVDLCEAVSD